MYTYSKSLKKKVSLVNRKNTFVTDNQSPGIAGSEHVGPYASQSSPYFSQKVSPISNNSPSLQKLSAQRTAVEAKTVPMRQPVDIQRLAADGVQGVGQRLPHADRIQKAFGHHDIRSVQSYQGARAIRASKMIGARAYASGNKVAFADSRPDLHTAAHEAAHIIQQRNGVHLKGGVGEAGDRYEQQADKVADSVVQGRPAESLLDNCAGSPSHAGLNGQPLQSQTVVQRKVGFEFETGWLVEKYDVLRGSTEDKNSLENSYPLYGRRSLTKKERIGNTKYTGFRMEADEAGENKSEIEFVIDPPVAENEEGLKLLEKIMDDIRKIGDDLIGVANIDNREEFSLDEVTKNKSDDNFYIKPKDRKSLSATPQVTTGIALTEIHNFLNGIGSNSVKEDEKSSFSGTPPKTRGLMLLLAQYIRGGTGSYVDRQGEHVSYVPYNYPKRIGEPLLARTDFSKLFNLIEEEQKKVYRNSPDKFVQEVLAFAGTPDFAQRKLFSRGIQHDDNDELKYNDRDLRSEIDILSNNIKEAINGAIANKMSFSSKSKVEGKLKGKQKSSIGGVFLLPPALRILQDYLPKLMKDPFYELSAEDLAIVKDDSDCNEIVNLLEHRHLLLEKRKDYVYYPELTIADWLKSIVEKGIDKLPLLKDAESLGEYKNKTEFVGPKEDIEAGIFEYRGDQDKRKISWDKWKEYALKRLNFIIALHKASYERNNTKLGGNNPVNSSLEHLSKSTSTKLSKQEE